MGKKMINEKLIQEHKLSIEGSLDIDNLQEGQMTEMCGVDIISLFNSAYDIVTLDGKRYRKITSCALLKDIQSINLPNANRNLGKGCYLIFKLI